MRLENVLENVIAALIVAGILGVLSLAKAWFDIRREAPAGPAARARSMAGPQPAGAAPVRLPPAERPRTSGWKLFLRMMIGWAVLGVSGTVIDAFWIPAPPAPEGMLLAASLLFGALLFVVNGLRLVYRMARGMFRLLV